MEYKDVDRIIEMAWEDRTPFEAIEFQFGLKEQDVIEFMRKQLASKSFKRWRKRVQGRHTKHRQLQEVGVKRFKCSRQRTISMNKVT